MPISTHSPKNDLQILALGAESAGNFSVFSKGHFFHSEDFGDLLEPKNFARFQKSVLAFLKKEKIKPDVIITDLHPLYVTSVWGKELAKKLKTDHVEAQHHIAHIFSQISNFKFQNSKLKIKNSFYGIALDGTGYGLDGKIWGGEIFHLQVTSYELQVTRIGHLENQILIGGELAIKEPARVLISILSKFLSKEEVFEQVKKYYSTNQFEILWNQLQQNFNCLETSSVGRILDAVSVLLGFAKNERKEKHGATYLLEKNSTKPYLDLRPKIKKINDLPVASYQLLVTPLFEYLIKNINRDKKRLAATTQLYIAEGLHKIIYLETKNYKLKTILSGGISNNKIISKYFESKNLLQNKKSRIARGDAGLSVGQINYILLNL